jgi:hypothetical protein
MDEVGTEKEWGEWGKVRVVEPKIIVTCSVIPFPFSHYHLFIIFVILLIPFVILLTPFLVIILLFYRLTFRLKYRPPLAEIPIFFS